MNTKSRPCTDDPSYDFYHCVESFFYEQHGCQYPWNTFKGLDTPICSNITHILNMVNVWDRSKGLQRNEYSNIQRMDYTKNKCVLPCTDTRYSVIYKNNEEEMEHQRTIDNNIQTKGKYTLVISFDNFLFEHRDEYLGCDTNCIVGELGGNLGYFLGGSILAFLDLVIIHAAKLASKINRLHEPSTREFAVQ